MRARIYQPARNAMQSGQGKTKTWILEFVPSSARSVDPLMGWTSSDDMDSQVRMQFDSQEAAEGYANANGIAYNVAQPKERAHLVRPGGYAENFSPTRRETWTH